MNEQDNQVKRKEKKKGEEYYSILSDKAILQNMEQGHIVIKPFKRENLSTSSYDVVLGKYYYREQNSGHSRIYNPYDEAEVERIWGPVQTADLAGDKFNGISPDDLVIYIAPGETILCHTEEFIGGRYDITTMMKARSSMGRNFIEVCKCAGWGDIGYINRWTMEITNNSQYYTIPLVVGRRIAQIVFFKTAGILDKTKSYPEQNSKYQCSTNFSQLQESWTPDAMLPRLFKDAECNK